MSIKWVQAVLAGLLFLTLAAPVGADDGQGQVVLPGGSLLVGSGEDLPHDVVVFGGTLELRQGGRIRGDVVVIAGEGTINGQVDGNVVVVIGRLHLRPQAVIEGDLAIAASGFDRDPGATVRGQVQDALRWSTPIVPGRWNPLVPSSEGGMLRLLGSLLQWMMTNAALIVAGVLLLYFLPRQVAMVQESIMRAAIPSAGVGLLTLLALAIVLPLLVIICLGIPIAAVVGLIAATAGLFGWLVVSIGIGRRILSTLNVPVPHYAVEVMAGVLTVSLLTAVPCIGWLMALTVLSAGLGAVALTRFGTTPYPPA